MPKNADDLGRVVIASLSNFVQIRDVQTYAGQQVLNVYYYRLAILTTASGNLASLLTKFKTSVVDVVRALQNTGVAHQFIDAKNLNNIAEIASLAVNLNGLRAGLTAAPSFMAWSFQLARTTAATRNGYKRIVGMSEEDFSSNSVVTTPALLTNVANALKLELLDADGNTWQPVIARKSTTPGNPVPPAYNNIANVLSQTLVSSQTTRKVGRGS